MDVKPIKTEEDYRAALREIESPSMAHEFAYPVMLTPEEVDGGFVVTFPDLPEAITQGEDAARALEEAADALAEAIAGRIRRGDPIPRPSTTVTGQLQVP